MADELDDILRPHTVEELVANWFAGQYTLTEACIEQPETAWKAIHEILARELSQEQRVLLGAGPLENLLASHGPSFIDRVEEAARSQGVFAEVLGYVWRQNMPEEIWQRVLVAQK